MKIAIGSTSFAWFPLYAAYGAGYFRDEGIDLEIINVAANSTPVAAMMGGSVDMRASGCRPLFPPSTRDNRSRF